VVLGGFAQLRDDIIESVLHLNLSPVQRRLPAPYKFNLTHDLKKYVKNIKREKHTTRSRCANSKWFFLNSAIRVFVCTSWFFCMSFISLLNFYIITVLLMEIFIRRVNVKKSTLKLGYLHWCCPAIKLQRGLSTHQIRSSEPEPSCLDLDCALRPGPRAFHRRLEVYCTWAHRRGWLCCTR